MGLLRILLALGVVTEHAGRSYFIGSYTAVQIFFIISGFYMALILSSARYKNTSRFYASRLARLFPVYWISIFVVVIFAFWVKLYFDAPSAITHLVSVLQDLYQLKSVVFLWTIVANVFLFTADFSWFLQPLEMGRHPTQLLILPPIWTLALELYFYSMCPWLVRARTSALLGIIGFALAARVIGYLYGLDANPYHARFFFFEVFFFVLGILTYRLYAHKENILTRWLLGVGGGCYCVVYLLLVLFFYDMVKWVPGPALYGGYADYLHSITMCLLSVPAIVALFSRTRDSWLDFQLGELSYPIYVIHYGFVSTLIHTKVALPGNLSNFWVVIVMSIVSGFILNYLVQTPVDRWRQRFLI